MDRLEATVQGTVFRNPENGYSVVTVTVGREESTVVGTLPELSSGEQVVFTGEWTEHRTYGRQFRCTGCEIQTPTSLRGIERYLGSGLIRGVGPSTASLIVSTFGEETLTILSEHPEMLRRVPGIGKKRMEMIADGRVQAVGDAVQAVVFQRRLVTDAAEIAPRILKSSAHVNAILIHRSCIGCHGIEIIVSPPRIAGKTFDLSVGLTSNRPRHPVEIELDTVLFVACRFMNLSRERNAYLVLIIQHCRAVSHIHPLFCHICHTRGAKALLKLKAIAEESLNVVAADLSDLGKKMCSIR